MQPKKTPKSLLCKDTITNQFHQCTIFSLSANVTQCYNCFSLCCFLDFENNNESDKLMILSRVVYIIETTSNDNKHTIQAALAPSFSTMGISFSVLNHCVHTNTIYTYKHIKHIWQLKTCKVYINISFNLTSSITNNIIVTKIDGKQK